MTHVGIRPKYAGYQPSCPTDYLCLLCLVLREVRGSQKARIEIEMLYQLCAEHGNVMATIMDNCGRMTWA